MLFKEIMAIDYENHTKHKDKMHSYWMLKQAVHIVTTGL
jgi:hypothetical protein